MTMINVDICLIYSIFNNFLFFCWFFWTHKSRFGSSSFQRLPWRSKLTWSNFQRRLRRSFHLWGHCGVVHSRSTEFFKRCFGTFVDRRQICTWDRVQILLLLFRYTSLRLFHLFGRILSLFRAHDFFLGILFIFLKTFFHALLLAVLGREILWIDLRGPMRAGSLIQILSISQVFQV